jgi:hypothetical protein
MQIDITIDELGALLDGLRGETTLEEAISEVDRERIDDLAKVNDIVRDDIAGLHQELKRQRGALEETVTQLRTLQQMAEHTGPWTVESKKSNGKTPMVRGIYCRFCGKDLDTKKSQKIFCSQACAGRWQGQHKGQTPTPRYTLKDEKIGTTVVAGVGVRD